MEDVASVLVVDDDFDSREAVSRFLRKAGHHVVSVENGQRALAALADVQPDVVVLDAVMPEMDGVTFLEVIRCYLRWSNLPVIMVTAYSEGHHIKRAVELGVRKTLLKTEYDLADLLKCVESYARPGEPGSLPACEKDWQ